MIKKSLISLAALASVFVLAPSIDAEAKAPEAPKGHWAVTQGKDWFAVDDTSYYDTYIHSGVFKVGSAVYGFNQDGYLAKAGWFYDTNTSDWYYLRKDSKVLTGWVQDGDKWYYLDPAEDGRMVAGDWVSTGGYDYYFNYSGEMVTDTLVSQYGYNYDTGKNENLYYILDKDGRAVYKKGWQLVGDNYYYVTNTGKGYILKDTWIGDYYVTSSGARAKYPTKVSYVTANGTSKYVTVTDDSYNGVEGTYGRFGNTTYQFGFDGTLVKGWYKTSSVKDKYPSYIYSNSKGEIADGWIKDGNDYYYSYNGRILYSTSVSLYKSAGYPDIYRSGTAAYVSRYDSASKKYITYKKAETYLLDEYGKMIVGSHTYPDYSSSYYWSKGSTVYTDKDGKALNGWRKLNGKDVYYSNGSLLKDTFITEYATKDGKYSNYDSDYAYDADGNYISLEVKNSYYFDKNGYMITGWYNISSNADYENWIYGKTSGQLVHDDFFNIGGKYYYFAGVSMASGRYVSEYTSADGKVRQYDRSYYYDEKGNYVSLKFAGRYYIKDDGTMLTGWYNTSDDSSYESWIYAKSTGKLAEDEFALINNKYYFFEGYTWAKDRYVTEYSSEDGKIVQYNNSYYYDGNKGTWLKYSGTYYVKPDGTMLTGWYNTSSNSSYENWIYANASGRLANSEFVKIGNAYYYFDGHSMVKDEIRYIGDNRYYFKPDGTMLANAVYDRGYNIVGATASGILYYDGWALIGGKYYYFSYGSARKNTQAWIDGSCYYFNANGTMATGWYQLDASNSDNYKSEGRWIYIRPTGVVATGWTKIGNDWYYFDEYGDPETGVVNTADMSKFYAENPEPYFDYSAYEHYCDSETANRYFQEEYSNWNKKRDEYKAANTYVFDKYGKLVTGWYQMNTADEKTWLYADSNGNAYTGWVKSSGKDYYIENGRMLTNSYVGNYFVGSDGACVA